MSSAMLLVLADALGFCVRYSNGWLSILHACVILIVTFHGIPGINTTALWEFVVYRCAPISNV